MSLGCLETSAFKEIALVSSRADPPAAATGIPPETTALCCGDCKWDLVWKRRSICVLRLSDVVVGRGGLLCLAIAVT